MSHQRGLFVAVEGADFCGKTTFVKQLKEILGSRDISSVIFRSPGGTEAGEKLRELVTNVPFSEEARTLLFSANRLENTQNLIDPLIKKGINVISTRWRWSSDVYQDNQHMANYIDQNLGIVTPDIYILLECSDEVMVKCANSRNIDHPDYNPETNAQMDLMDSEYTENYALVKQRFNESFDKWEGKKFKFVYNTGEAKPPTDETLIEIIEPFLKEIGFFERNVISTDGLIHDARFEYEGEPEPIDDTLIPMPRV